MNENEPTDTWTCDCGRPMARHRGRGDQNCPECGQWFNAVGQRLRSNWMNNPSLYDDNIGDLEGFELAEAAAEAGHP
ncbi:hypothetical protein [Arthrobacter castelli]|uniref:hypothetical protein n=1 Tax=Arthrobacter castelli TaxID=271431 RepID=UPI000687B8E0|nr:hypothetical protein [Arthrobacter castelli]